LHYTVNEAAHTMLEKGRVKDENTKLKCYMVVARASEQSHRGLYCVNVDVCKCRSVSEGWCQVESPNVKGSMSC
jgi:hypothetical protein